MLLTLAGWTSPRIAGGVWRAREETVRLWRSDFAAGGVAALKTRIAPGLPPVKSEAALRVATPLLEEPVADRRNRMIPRLRAEIEAREGVRNSRSQPSKAWRKKFRWRRPRHTLKGRQTESEVERVGLRLQLHKQQAEAGDIVLLCGDESEALTHPYLARAWAKSGADLRRRPGRPRRPRRWGRSITSRANSSSIPAPPSAAAISSPIWSSSTVTGPQRGRQAKPVVLIEDNGPTHTSKRSLGAPGCPRAMAHRRVAATCTRTQRHRAGMARPQSPSPRPSDLHRCRSARPSHSTTPSSISTVSASRNCWRCQESLISALVPYRSERER